MIIDQNASDETEEDVSMDRDEEGTDRVPQRDQLPANCSTC